MAVNDLKQEVDQIPPGNTYSRLFQMVAGLQEEVSTNRKSKSMTVLQDQKVRKTTSDGSMLCLCVLDKFPHA
ncbi:hypothetical protein FRX31_012734 [Thalictrum thalictroides]|uniref:Uncharacterized protein n=1 Tax=Thalictrum thalictroides TaxID=46969 RepID=A0A7J6WJX0_THATH|nr:hypothetical protein FRX31_012734 [Thalictrum thalictroides]